MAALGGGTCPRFPGPGIVLEGLRGQFDLIYLAAHPRSRPNPGEQNEGGYRRIRHSRIDRISLLDIGPRHRSSAAYPTKISAVLLAPPGVRVHVSSKCQCGARERHQPEDAANVRCSEHPDARVPEERSPARTGDTHLYRPRHFTRGQVIGGTGYRGSRQWRHPVGRSSRTVHRRQRCGPFRSYSGPIPVSADCRSQNGTSPREKRARLPRTVSVAEGQHLPVGRPGHSAHID